MLIGVDVGGTNLRVGVVDGLRVIDEQRVNADFAGLCRSSTPDRALQAIQAMLVDVLSASLRKYPAVTAVGLGFPGFIVSGRVVQSPNLPGLVDVDLVAPLGISLGCPVIIENDALAAAYGEYRLALSLNPLTPDGQARPHAGLVYLGLGTGVGGGLIAGGAPYSGEHGVAMEVGHLIVEPDGRLCGCGNRGCMEQYASASGVAMTYLELSGNSLMADQIAERAATGDAHAIAAYALAGAKLAQALAHILKVVDIGQVVIGGGMSAAWPWLRAGFEQRLDLDLIPALRGKIRITLSRAGDQAGMIGASWLAMEKTP
ncbi:N-acetyl-D-glucosamine kinase [mine drainage metagenome]|uniref:N-acetyl-D-glucosamine kinase n=1 Tax=mine drainage metagenome TaxID=410659 RepID=A0A1J5QKQ1_9ZZZZ